jgi:hypothetical protein
MGQMEMKCIFNIGKNMSILAKVTQVSDVAHGPLVTFILKPIVLLLCTEEIESIFAE